MGLFHSHSSTEYPRLNNGEPLQKVKKSQYIIHYLYGKFEPSILRLGDYLLKRFHKYKTSKPRKANRIRNLIKFLNNENLPRSLVITTHAAKNIIEHVLTAEGPKGARLAVGPCVCQTALHIKEEPNVKDMVILYGADIYLHLNRGYKIIDLEEGKELLDEFHIAGLAPNLDYCMQSGKWVFVVCNCDSKICVSYRGDEVIGDIMRKGPEIAQKEEFKCIGFEKCGNCIRRCVYGANSLENGSVVYDPEKCKGCGLCVSTCLGDAKRMIKRENYAYEHIVLSSLLLRDLYE